MNLNEVKKNKKQNLRSNEMAKNKAHQKAIGKKFVKGGKVDYELIPTGIAPLDRALNGGVVRGGHIHVWAKEGLGKTNLFTHIAKTIQDNYEKDIYWADTEGNFNTDWAKRIGLDTDDVYFATECYSGEDHLEMLLESTRKYIEPDKYSNYGDISAFILDSIDNMVPMKQLDHGVDDVRASNAHLMSRVMGQINSLRTAIGNNDEVPPTFFWVSQVRDNQSSPAGGFTYSGGHMIKHSWTQSIRITSIEYLDEKFNSLPRDKRADAKYYRNTLIIERNRNGRNGVKCEIIFDIENARFDNIAMLIFDKTRFVQSGAWFQLGEKKFQGISNFKMALEEDASLLEELKKVGEDDI